MLTLAVETIQDPSAVFSERPLSNSPCIRDLALTWVPRGHDLFLATRWAQPLRHTLDFTLALLEGGCLAWPLHSVPWCTGEGLHYHRPFLRTGLTPSRGSGGRLMESLSPWVWEASSFCWDYDTRITETKSWRVSFITESERPKKLKELLVQVRQSFYSFGQGCLKLGLGFEHRKTKISPLLAYL